MKILSRATANDGANAAQRRRLSSADHRRTPARNAQGRSRKSRFLWIVAPFSGKPDLSIDTQAGGA